MSKIIARVPCPQCRIRGLDNSGDNLKLYDDGHAHCYSCRYHLKQAASLGLYLKYYTKDNIRYLLPDPSVSLGSLSPKAKEYTKGMIDNYRGLTKNTLDFFQVGSIPNPPSLTFQHGSMTKLCRMDKKAFHSEGDSSAKKLFGQDRFQGGSALAVTITEGELDAMSVYQMLGSKYPVVSVWGAASARADCERARDYLNSFEKIYLCFDNDEPGEKAAKEVAQLFDVNKVWHVKLDKHKDANDFLKAGEAKAFVSAWFNAKKFMPKGIISGQAKVAEILATRENKAIASYPFPSLEAMSYGIRSGELVLFTALEKVGKTEVLRAIEYNLLKTTEDNLGIIHLEEREKRSVQGLVGYELGAPVHLPDSGFSVSDQIAAFSRLEGRDGRTFFYPHFGSEDPNVILDIIRYLVAVCRCRYIFLDHITMLVTGRETQEDERRDLDKISTKLAEMTRELDFTLFMISHVNDNGQTRGSRNIAKVADLIIHLDRDIEAALPEERNKTRLTCRGNRYAGITGPAGTLVFDPKTFKLTEEVIVHDQAPDLRTPSKAA